MASNLFNRYIWLVDIISRKPEGLTFEEINEKWERSSNSEGNPIPLRTFHNHRVAIEELFEINIECNKSTYKYTIENAEDLEKGGVRRWLLNTFAVNNLINESHKLKQQILFEDIPSGQQFLTPIIEAMRDGVMLEMTYHSYWRDNAYTFTFEPYFVKVFKHRWYVIGKSDNVRIYALDRIQKLETLTTKYKMPNDPYPEEYFYNCFGIIHDENGYPEKIKLKITSSQANYLRALPLHHSQKEIKTSEDYSIFTYYIKPTFDFRQEILSLGEDAEVLSPAAFRDEIGKVILKMSGYY